MSSPKPLEKDIFSDDSISHSKSPSITKSSPVNSVHTYDSHSHSRSRSQSRESSPYFSNYPSKFIMKNGCCKECMRAFSKTGKSCLCQVPKSERKYTLSEKGCNFCGCHGCNPIDVRKDRRSEMKRQLREDKNLQYKNQRLLDSDDEELKINVKDVDLWNLKKKEFLEEMKNILKCNPFLMGFGAPLRTQGYILGYVPSKGNGKRKRNERENIHRRKDSY